MADDSKTKRAKLVTITLTVNGDEKAALIRPNATLLEVLRENFDMTGTKKACELGDCGACTVILDGEPVNSCIVLALEADGHEVRTIEGLEKDGELDILQKKFIEHGAIQCGYCSPGMILSGRALLDRNPSPTEMEVRKAIAGNLCRCTGYVKIVEAIMAAASAGV